MFVPDCYGSPGQNPLSEGKKRRVSACVIHDGDEEQVLDYKFRPEVWFTCIRMINSVPQILGHDNED